MYSWLWAKLKLCQYRFIMVTRRAQDQVKETLKQPYQTTVSIECLPCLCIDAASYHEVCQKNATTWGGRVDWNLHFLLLKEFHWNYDVNQKATWQSNIKNHQCKYKVLCIYIYIYTVFAIAVYLGSTYTLIYYTWSTNWHNESLCFKMLLGKELCHSCSKTTYQKTIESIELQKASNQE